VVNTESNVLQKGLSYRLQAALYSFAIVGAVALIVAVMVVFKPKPEPKQEEKTLATKVDTLVVTLNTQRISVVTQGSVSPLHKINLISEVAGRVVSASEDYANGGFFSKDSPIAVVDGRDYTFALRQAESEVAKAKELYAIEKGRARQAKREWREIGDKEANDLFLRQPQLTAAKAAVDAAKANRDKARLDLDRTRISAPFNGRISIKHVDVGQYVTPGTVIAEVYSTDAVEVRLPLTDRQVANVDLPMTADPKEPLPDVILSAVYGGRPYQWQGKIVRTEATLDIKSRVVYAVAEVWAPYSVAESSGRPPLSAGMYVSAKILGRQTDNVVKLPRKVLQKKDQITLVDTNDELQYRTVEVLQSNAEEVLVRGLSAGERVLLTRVPYAVAGLKVDLQSDKAIAENPVDETPPPITAQGG